MAEAAVLGCFLPPLIIGRDRGGKGSMQLRGAFTYPGGNVVHLKGSRALNVMEEST